MMALEEANRYASQTNFCEYCKQDILSPCGGCPYWDYITLSRQLIKNQLKYKWHDLINNPNDLPEDNKEVLVTFRHYFSDMDETAVLYHTEEGWIYTLGFLHAKIIAWREIEPFEVKE